MEPLPSGGAWTCHRTASSSIARPATLNAVGELLPSEGVSIFEIDLVVGLLITTVGFRLKRRLGAYDPFALGSLLN